MLYSCQMHVLCCVRDINTFPYFYPFLISSSLKLIFSFLFGWHWYSRLKIQLEILDYVHRLGGYCMASNIKESRINLLTQNWKLEAQQCRLTLVPGAIPSVMARIGENSTAIASDIPSVRRKRRSRRSCRFLKEASMLIRYISLTETTCTS
jgi:hypothetical protein